MYAQAAVKPNPLLRNGAYGIVMRGVQKCTRGCSSLRGRNRLPLCCIKLDTATDLGCGTGSMLCEMSRRGAVVTGVDNSEDMLSVADNKLFNKHLRSELRLADIAEYNDSLEYDFIYCICDTINYLNKERLSLLFSNVSSLLKDGGIFTFDIINKSMLKLYEKYLLADGATVEFSRETDNDVLNTSVAITTGDIVYRELHTQYVYDKEIYIDMAKLNNSDVFSICEFMTFDKPSPQADKLQISLKKE